MSTRYKYPLDLNVGDIITTGHGVYLVTGRCGYPAPAVGSFVHISVTTIAGQIMGGLTRSPLEYITTLASVEPDPGRGIEGMRT